jgi:carbonic anhydrase-like protein
MQKLFHFDSPPEPYRADACVVCCFDARFELVLRKFLKRRGIFTADQIRVAGGAKCLASPREEAERAYALEQIRLSLRLHEAARVLLMMHSDCGAYQGLAAFGGDAAREAEHHFQELETAAGLLKQEIPGVPVECMFVDFSGVWQA